MLNVCVKSTDMGIGERGGGGVEWVWYRIVQLLAGVAVVVTPSVDFIKTRFDFFRWERGWDLLFELSSLARGYLSCHHVDWSIQYTV